MRRHGHFFPEQHENERIILFTRRHWIVFLGHTITAAIIGGVIEIALLLAYFYFPDLADDPDTVKVLIFLGAIIALMIWLIIYIGWVDYYLDVWMISNERIVEIKQNALFNRQISELNLEKIQDVNAKVVGFWGTLLGYGTILVQTAGSTEMFEFLRIPKPYEVQKVILMLRTQYQEKGKEELSQIFQGQTRNIRQIKPLLQYSEKKSNDL